MFDFRYHALSLVAVFLALGIGILLGVTIGDSLVSRADRGLRDSLREDVVHARERQAIAADGLEAREELIAALVPALVRGRLAGDRVALVSVGALPEGLEADVRSAVELAGGELDTAAALPLDPPSRDRADLIDEIRRKVGGADAVAVHVEATGDAGATQDWQASVLEALAAAGGEVVGVEQSGPLELSQVPFYEDQDIASVDNVDSAGGQAVLVMALDGARGSFGYKRGADAVLPRGAVRFQR